LKRLVPAVLPPSFLPSGRSSTGKQVSHSNTEMLSGIREIIPDHFLLVPGVGAQGGSLEEVAKYGLNKDCGLLVNSSRGIIYAGNGADFAENARAEAQKLQQQMEIVLKEAGIC